jgi:hypothetical protein
MAVPNYTINNVLRLLMDQKYHWQYRATYSQLLDTNLFILRNADMVSMQHVSFTSRNNLASNRLFADSSKLI